MINYELGKIYEIVCLTTGKRYIGATTRRLLCMRLAEHVNQYRVKKNITKSVEVLEGGNYNINLLEAYPCKSRDELNVKEREWINKLECVNANGKYLHKKTPPPPPPDDSKE